MLKISIFLSILVLLSTSNGDLMTRFSDLYLHPCERLNETQIWAQNPRGCNLYYWCGNFPEKIGSGACPDGYHFHEENQSCNTIDDVKCEIDKNLWNAECRGNNAKKIAHPYSCSQYTVCIEDLQADFSCPDDLHFSPYDQDCVEPSVANCPRDQQSCEGAVPYIPFYIPSSRNCSVYYICFNGNLQRFNCAPGQHFNTERNWCEAEDIANCDTNGILSDVTDIPRTLSIDCRNYENGTRVPHEESCRFWFWCFNNRSQLFWCGKGALFDVNTRACTAESIATCYSSDPVDENDSTTEFLVEGNFETFKMIENFPKPPIRSDLIV